MSNHLTPVEVCEHLIGPLPELERLVGYRPKAGYAWRRSSMTRPPGDFPSTALQRRMLDHSDRHGLGLTAEHLIRGASLADVEAILEDRTTGASPTEVAAE